MHIMNKWAMDLYCIRDLFKSD